MIMGTRLKNVGKAKSLAPQTPLPGPPPADGKIPPHRPPSFAASAWDGKKKQTAMGW